MQYVFGDCTLDTELYAVHRAGQTIPLRPKVFQVLHYLLSHRDRVISKEDLREQVWADQFVSDAALEGALKAARQAVGDSRRTQWCIQTRRGQGYRFVAPLEEPVTALPGEESPAELSIPEPCGELTPEPVGGARAEDAPAPSRRQLTVMICNLVDSTALADQLDPEDFREVLLAYYTACTEVIQHFDGSIAQYLGDGLLIYFGYPHAHEDDAQRAIRTGLGMLEALRSLNTRLEHAYGVRLAVRLGLHTGLVVVGTVGGPERPEQLALGVTPNVAARLQSLALPNKVVLSEHVQRLAGGAFDFEDLGVHSLQGMAEPIHIYGVRGESAATSRFEAATATGLTPLVGRDEEIGLLLRRWEDAQEHEGQVVLLCGEPGIGKSRITQAVCERMTHKSYIRLHYQCSSYYTNSAFYPIIVQLERATRFTRDDTPVQKLDKLEAFLAQSTEAVAEVAPLFAALLAIPTGDRYAPLHLNPQRQKAKTIEALVDQIIGLSHHQPVLCIFEDVHWCDPTSLEVLDLLVQRVTDARALVVIAYRPEFAPPWGAAAHVTTHALNRLTRRKVTAMVAGVTGGKAVPDAVLDQIIAKTDGVPLFVEELTKTILESGLLADQGTHYTLTGPLPPLAIPATLQDALMARLDRLAAVKDVAQIGAVLGREFAYELLAAVSPLRDDALQDALDQLVTAGLLFRRGPSPETRYRFKHALVQNAAYVSLLKSTRQQLHTRIAAVLKEQFPVLADAEPEVLAHHYTEAGRHAEAIPYWQRAGQRAIARLAYVEAIAHLNKGLEMLTALPATPERTQYELSLLVTLGMPLVATEGYAAPDVAHTYARAQDLCQQGGDAPQVFPVLFGLSVFYLTQGEVQRARELGEQLFRLASHLQEPTRLVGAHIAMGAPLLWLGELDSARSHFEQGIALYNPQQHRAYTALYRNEPGVACLFYGAISLWVLGYPDQALHRSREAVALAREQSHPFSLAWAMVGAAGLHQFRREVWATQDQVEAVITLSMEHGFVQWLSAGNVLGGWALAAQGRGVAGITQMRQGLDAWRATGAGLTMPYYLSLLAGAYGTVGQIEEGLHVLAEALTLGKTGECWYEAELYRLQGELLLLLSSDHHIEAATCFHHALDVAHRQHAKSWELRAAMSLAHLWQSQNERQKAYDLLAPVYGWFTEGFDTADLQDAKGLLDELAH